MLTQNIQIIILGSGTSSPSAEHGSPGCLLITPQTMILLDSGSGTMFRLSKAGFDLHKIDGICYTHHHVDHTGDLIPILQGKKWDPRSDKTVKDFHFLAPDSVIDYYYQSLDFFGPHAIGNEPDKLRLIEHPMMENSTFNLNDIKITAFRVNHTPDSIGYKFEIADKTIAYTGDMQFEGSNFNKVKKCDIFITECSFPNTEESIGHHMNPYDLKKLSQVVEAKKYIITHLYPGWSREEMAPLCNLLEEDKRFTLSHDFMLITLKPDGSIITGALKIND